jgi:hypothetical protein
MHSFDFSENDQFGKGARFWNLIEYWEWTVGYPPIRPRA